MLNPLPVAVGHGVKPQHSTLVFRGRSRVTLDPSARGGRDQTQPLDFRPSNPGPVRNPLCMAKCDCCHLGAAKELPQPRASAWCLKPFGPSQGSVLGCMPRGRFPGKGTLTPTEGCHWLSWMGVILAQNQNLHMHFFGDSFSSFFFPVKATVLEIQDHNIRKAKKLSQKGFKGVEPPLNIKPAPVLSCPTAFHFLSAFPLGLRRQQTPCW